jgi:hypothetical protein
MTTNGGDYNAELENVPIPDDWGQRIWRFQRLQAAHVAGAVNALRAADFSAFAKSTDA